MTLENEPRQEPLKTCFDSPNKFRKYLLSLKTSSTKQSTLGLENKMSSQMALEINPYCSVTGKIVYMAISFITE